MRINIETILSIIHQSVRAAPCSNKINWLVDECCRCSWEYNRVVISLTHEIQCCMYVRRCARCLRHSVKKSDGCRESDFISQSSIIVRFIERFRVGLLIMVPIDPLKKNASARIDARVSENAVPECVHSVNFVSNKWNVFAIYGSSMGHGRL